MSTLNNQPVCYGISAYESNAMKSANPNSGIYKADTTRTLDNNGGNPACNQGGMMVLDGFNLAENEKLSPTLTCQRVDTKNVPSVYGIDRASFNQGKNAQYDFQIQEELAQTIVAKGPGAVMAKR